MIDPLPREQPRALTLLLVRHGITAWNAEGRLQGQTDIPLTDQGREQARALGRRLQRAWSSGSQQIPGPPQAIYTSDLSRALETGRLLAQECAFLSAVRSFSWPLLRERGFGDWEGLTAAEALAKFGPDRSYRDEGEAHHLVWNRMQTALAQIWSDMTVPGGSGVALIVGHGGSLRKLVCIANGLEDNAAQHFPLDNCSLSVLELRGTALETARGRIRLWNDTSHLTARSDGGGEI